MARVVDVKFEAEAYAKIIFHAAKYPHCAVNGLLLAETSKCKDASKIKEIKVVDAVPLFHLCLHVTPMMEIALTQIETWGVDNGLTIVGYYVANENFRDNTIERCPLSSHRIADKIADNFSAALFTVVDNQEISLSAALRVYQNVDGKWRQQYDSDMIGEDTFDVVTSLLRQGSVRNIVDFDNYLDNVKLDWTNQKLGKDIRQLIEMSSN